MKYILFLMTLFLAGCISTPQRMDKLEAKIDKLIEESPKEKLIEEVGEKTKIVAHVLGDLPKTFNWMVVLLVGGVMFWGFTRSKLGWVTPSAALVGMATMISFARYADWIGLIAIAIGLAVIIYKAVEYQRERNENIKKE